MTARATVFLNQEAASFNQGIMSKLGGFLSGQMKQVIVRQRLPAEMGGFPEKLQPRRARFADECCCQRVHACLQTHRIALNELGGSSSDIFMEHVLAANLQTKVAAEHRAEPVRARPQHIQVTAPLDNLITWTQARVQCLIGSQVESDDWLEARHLHRRIAEHSHHARSQLLDRNL